jgi:hypothetical protein|tara:strand:+ start:59 stop:427 length:369 start_codon:yes stop_codon:yes gene_type:complete
MSLIKAMQYASKVRKKFGYVKPKRKGLRGGMWAKRKAIYKAYSTSTLGAAIHMSKMNKIKKMSGIKRFGAGRGLGIKGMAEAKAHFAKRYPRTDIGIGAAKVAGIGALGAWILNDGDSKKKT